MVLLHRRSGVVVDKMHHTLQVLAVLLLAFRYSEGRIVSSKNEIVRQLTPKCAQDEFRCQSSGRCIRSSWRCDGDNDCGDNSDEPKKCPGRCAEFSDWFKCVNQDSCFHKSMLCDGKQQCGDGTDEPSFCHDDDKHDDYDDDDDDEDDNDEDDGSGKSDSLPNKPVFECPPNFVRPTTGGSCYKLELTPMSWQNSSEYCANIHHGAHLVFIESIQEQRIVVNLLTAYRETSWWIGGERLHELQWSWKIHSPQGRVTSIQILYKNWASGEPNNANVGESCIALMNMAWWDGRWNDDVCSKKKHFICEL